MSRPIRMAQVGTRHGHAEGKLQAMLASPEVAFAGLFEPSARRRAELQASGGVWGEVHWFDRAEEILEDEGIVAVASEGRNDESLAQTEALVEAGKHVWYDKPAGDDWERWERVVASVRERDLHLQMGYMFRYHDGFRKVIDWVRTGLLGDVFSIRAQMSTALTQSQRRVIAVHRGGILYDLGGHMLDPIVTLLGRPEAVTAFLRNDDRNELRGFADNTLAVCGFDRAMATVEISAMEARPAARRFEVQGTRGSAILREPFEPGCGIRLCLREVGGWYRKGVQEIPFEAVERPVLYARELADFVRVVRDGKAPVRSLDHELQVQETLLRACGVVGEGASRT